VTGDGASREGLGQVKPPRPSPRHRLGGYGGRTGGRGLDVEGHALDAVALWCALPRGVVRPPASGAGGVVPSLVHVVMPRSKAHNVDASCVVADRDSDVHCASVDERATNVDNKTGSNP
jgi:hypothetical protein